jgi:hypothetical protein
MAEQVRLHFADQLGQTYPVGWVLNGVRQTSIDRGLLLINLRPPRIFRSCNLNCNILEVSMSFRVRMGIAKIPAAFAFTLIGSSAVADEVKCVEAYDFKHGRVCDSAGGTSMRVRNVCGHPIDMHYCLKRADGRWSCGVQFNTPPGGSTSWSVCQGDLLQSYVLNGRTVGSKEKFVTPQ